MLETRNFLMPDATFAIEMIAFLVVLVVMTRWVLPRIRASMQDRQLAISEALAAARDAEARRDAAYDDAAAVLTAARREARQIREQAWTTHDDVIAEAKRAGTEEYRWLAGRADRERQRLTELAQRRLRQEARTAAVAAARTYLGREVDESKIEMLVEEHFTATGAVRRMGRPRSERVAI